MIFNSLQFFAFFPAVTVIYYILPQKVRYLWLLAASYFFYMQWDASYALILLFSTLVTYIGAIIIQKLRDRQTDDKPDIRIKLCLAAGVILNLGVLAYFKYADFVIDNLNTFASCEMKRLDLILPVGISFFIFQTTGYLIDVSRGDMKAEKNPLKYALFVSFFPQLVAGPIERSKKLLAQINEKHVFSLEQTREGLVLMLWGYFLKLCIADRAALFINTVYGDFETYGGWYLIVASVLFAFQIYCDFAGYSIIAMGAAKVLGFSLMENFDAPYTSGSVSEFWRRWHISLFSWFKDYLYIPLGGNKKGTLRKYLNILIVFFCSGLWHGSQWTFVIWGFLNGFYQIAGEITTPFRKKAAKKLGIREDSLGNRCIKAVITFILVDISWVFFRIDALRSCVPVFSSMIHAKNFWIFTDGSIYEAGLNDKNFTVLIICLIILALYDLLKRKGIVLREVVFSQDLWCRWIIYLALILFIFVFGIYGSKFSDAGFIYFQF